MRVIERKIVLQAYWPMLSRLLQRFGRNNSASSNARIKMGFLKQFYIPCLKGYSLGIHSIVQRVSLMVLVVRNITLYYFLIAREFLVNVTRIKCAVIKFMLLTVLLSCSNAVFQIPIINFHVLLYGCLRISKKNLFIVIFSLTNR